MTPDTQLQPSIGHTPTPWECDWGPIPPDGPGTYCDVYVDGGDIIIARVNDCIASGHANAAFIVEAVNSHAALVKTLEHFVNCYNITHAYWNSRELQYALEEARAALSHRSAKT